MRENNPSAFPQKNHTTYQLTEADVFSGGMDDCGAVSFEGTDIFMVDCDDVGNTLSVTVMANDGNGNIGTCNANITVVVVNSLPDNWNAYDVGIVTIGNEYQYDPCEGNGQFHITGSGNNALGSTSDNVAFAATALCGDGSIIAKIEHIDPNGYGGLMIRETADAGAKQASIFSNLSNILRHEVRYTTNGIKTVNSFFKPFPYWLKLERQGDWVFTYYSTDGTNFQNVHGVFLPMQHCVEIGLASFTYLPSGQTSATFSNVSTTGNIQTLGGGTPTALAIETVTPQNHNTATPKLLNIFPNPTNAHFMLELEAPLQQGATVEVMTLNGQAIASRQMLAGAVRQEWQTADWATGTYMIVIKQFGQKLAVKKLLVVK